MNDLYLFDPNVHKYISDVDIEYGEQYSHTTYEYRYSNKVDCFQGSIPLTFLVMIEAKRILDNMFSNKGAITTKLIQAITKNSGKMVINPHINDLFVDNLYRHIKPILFPILNNEGYEETTYVSLVVSNPHFPADIKLVIVDDPILFKLENPNSNIVEVTPVNVDSFLARFINH